MTRKRTDEDWRRVPFAWGYQASTLGRVRSTRGPHGKRKTPLVLAVREGSVTVRFNDGRRRAVRVDLIVLLTFRGRAPFPWENFEVLHKDGDPANASLSNLRWVEVKVLRPDDPQVKSIPKRLREQQKFLDIQRREIERCFQRYPQP